MRFKSLCARIVQSRVTIGTVDPIISSSMVIKDVNPGGMHEMRVFIEGQYMETFEFIVEAD